MPSDHKLLAARGLGRQVPKQCARHIKLFDAMIIQLHSASRGLDQSLSLPGRLPYSAHSLHSLHSIPVPLLPRFLDPLCPLLPVPLFPVLRRVLFGPLNLQARLRDCCLSAAPSGRPAALCPCLPEETVAVRRVYTLSRRWRSDGSQKAHQIQRSVDDLGRRRARGDGPRRPDIGSTKIRLPLSKDFVWNRAGTNEQRSAG